MKRTQSWFKIMLPVLLVLGMLCMPAAAYACGGYHVVRHGETLSSIAYRHGTTAWAIAHANGLSNPNYIWAGQRLYIPCGSSGYVGRTCGSYHVVQRGQNLSMIGRWYGTTAWAIARANGLSNPNYIWAGQRLHIPCGSWSGWSWGYAGYHTVRHGETLSSIAYHYGTTVWVIARANGLRNPHYIYAGQRLIIP